MSLQKEAAAAALSTKCRASSSIGVGVEQIDGGGDAGPLFFGPAVKRRRQRDRGGRRWCGVKRISLPLPPYLYACQVRVVGMVVLHYPDRFCGKSPRGGTEWGGGSCNRATR
jgi:hypothetical protein